MGSWQHPYTIIDRIKKGRKIIIPGDGTSLWVLTWNGDFAKGLLGLLGGFLTPVLISTGQDNPLGLFGYIALLDVGLLAVACLAGATLVQFGGALIVAGSAAELVSVLFS